ncbi:hypothetical protein IscW_ISCW021198 [Ixodes scapularis]|uniref:Uncharacterized protein n=1 Tax=Ixodes scapularis TaxID=6945 RepID=B7Q5K8_IXOSC|nr:hypothetical protein IscW_ISCW021198 [Ixodes scapularis]|eukprot:XP_002402015.1 hypothetical protein IscW_ISCW021198 [Ixodes scapularis]
MAVEPAEPVELYMATVAELVEPFKVTAAKPRAPPLGLHRTQELPGATLISPALREATEQHPECSTLPEHLLAGPKPVDTLRSLQPSGPVDTERREATERTEHMEEPTEEPKEPVATLPRRRCRSSRPTTHKVNHREHISTSEPCLRARSAAAVLAPGPLTASIYLSLARRVTPVFLGEAIDGSAGRDNSDPIVARSL